MTKMKRFMRRLLFVIEFTLLMIVCLYWVLVMWWLDFLLWIIVGKWRLTLNPTSNWANKIFQHMGGTLDGEPYKSKIITIKKDESKSVIS